MGLPGLYGDEGVRRVQGEDHRAETALAANAKLFAVAPMMDWKDNTMISKRYNLPCARHVQ
jgi:hypothetical protein